MAEGTAALVEVLMVVCELSVLYCLVVKLSHRTPRRRASLTMASIASLAVYRSGPAHFVQGGWDGLWLVESCPVWSSCALFLGVGLWCIDMV